MNPFKIRRQWKVTYQYGLDGVRKEVQLSNVILAATVIFLTCVVILALLYLSGVKGTGLNSKAIEKLQKENAGLRDKLEYYSGLIDSIYMKLDTLKIIEKQPSEKEKLYPYNRSGNEEALDNTFVYDSYLDARINSIEGKLKVILTGITEMDSGDPISIASASGSSGFPADGPSIYPTFGRWSDGWGVRMHPFAHRLCFHYGVDLANKTGTPIYATGDGEVIATAYDPEYGKLIKIQHANGYETRYGHLYRFEVAIGDQVKKGQIIAQMGNTGMSTGPHLHYEVRINGAKVNPARYLNRFDDAVYYAHR
jgi:murein DD-endopeptidase MepM/ murein hydrolase activator NlpD